MKISENWDFVFSFFVNTSREQRTINAIKTFTFFSFQVAEDKLDIPSLLDAEDMLASEEPDKFSVVTYLAQFYHLFKTADSNISPNVSLHLGTSSESESEAATPLGTPTSEKKNFSTSEKKSFDRNDLIERYGEEIFQNNKASNQFSSLFLQIICWNWHSKNSNIYYIWPRNKLKKYSFLKVALTFLFFLWPT